MLTNLLLAQDNFLGNTITISILVIVVFIIGFIMLVLKCWRKVTQGTALVRNGWGGTNVKFDGMFVIPIFHKVELMDISVKKIGIDRNGEDGLICKDNIRADIRVDFFVRVNKEAKSVDDVAQLLGCERASSQPSHSVVRSEVFRSVENSR